MFTPEEETQETAPSFEMIDGQLVDTTPQEPSTTEDTEEPSDNGGEPPENNTPDDAQPGDSDDKDNPSEPSTATSPDDEPNEPSDNDAPDVSDEEDERAFLSELSNEVGMEFESTDQITQALKDYATLKNQDPFESDPEIKAFKEFKDAGGNVSQYFALKSKDFESMDSKALLKEQWMLDNKDLVAKDPEFAEKRFNREMKSKYGLIDIDLDSMDEEEREEWMEQNGEELEFQKSEIQYNSDQAKEKLLEWQDKATTPPAKSEPEMTTEEAETIQREWESSLENTVKEFDGFNIPLEGVDDFSVGLHPEELNEIKDSVKEPGEYISKLFGYDQETGQIDTKKLFQVAAKVAKFDSLGQLLNDYILEQRNLETIEGKQTNPSKPDQQHPGTRDLTERELLLQARRID